MSPETELHELCHAGARVMPITEAGAHRVDRRERAV